MDEESGGKQPEINSVVTDTHATREKLLEIVLIFGSSQGYKVRINYTLTAVAIRSCETVATRVQGMRNLHCCNTLLGTG
jgi:hypothetical protein